MLSGIRSFYNNNFGNARDFVASGAGTATIVGGATAVGAGIGAAVGASRQAQDVVTIEKVPYPESYQVQVGTHTEHGCYQYHYGYNFSSGNFDYHYGYDSSCTRTVPTYETRYTGRTLYNDVKHHTVGFPNSIVQGALLGGTLGFVAGVAGSIALRAAADS